MPERFTIVVNGRDGLTVEDAMRQVLDAFELLDRTNPEPDKPIKWRLVSASTNSPFTVVAEALPVRAGFNVDRAAREQKLEFVRSFAELRSGRLPAIWSNTDSRRRAKALIARTMNGVASTEIKILDTETPLRITAEDARLAVPALESVPLPIHPRVQIGSIEGYLSDVGTHYRKPSIKIVDRRTRNEITCLVPDEFRAKINTGANFDDVWQGRRVIVRGKIYYNASGAIEQIVASTVDVVPKVDVDSARLKDPTFTDGLSAEEYLRRLRDGEIG